jgi:hypothetical protein
MSYPINVNLNLVESLKGGNSIAVLEYVNNVKYRYLIGIKDGLEYFFEFTGKNNKSLYSSENQKRSRDTNGRVISYYYEIGTYNAIFTVRDKYNDNDELLLKIKQTIDNEQMSNIYTNKFIQKYNSDKLLFPYNTPDLLYVGLIIKNNNYDKYLYHITRNYRTNFGFLNLEQRKIFLKNLIESLISVHSNYMYVNDLKYANIAFDQHLHPIYIDYDEKTFNSIFTDNICRQSLFPLYVMNEIKNKIGRNVYCLDIKDNQDKVDVIGFCDIVLRLFFNDKIESLYFDNNNPILLKPPDEIKKNIKNEYYFKATQNLERLDIINIFVENLNPKFRDDEEFNRKLKMILINADKGLLHPEYDKIYTFDEIYTILYGSEEYTTIEFLDNNIINISNSSTPIQIDTSMELDDSNISTYKTEIYHTPEIMERPHYKIIKNLNTSLPTLIVDQNTLLRTPPPNKPTYILDTPPTVIRSPNTPPTVIRSPNTPPTVIREPDTPPTEIVDSDIPINKKLKLFGDSKSIPKYKILYKS